MKTVIITTVALAATAVFLVLAVVLSGWYPVSAEAQHGRVERWLLRTAKHASVSMSAARVQVPDLADPAMAAAGAGAYAAMCAVCHGAPGVDRRPLGVGLNPPAPDPAAMVADWSAAELFWIVENGLRMTGMPAWGRTHDERQLWEIVAFLQRMPEMTPEEYLRWTARAEHDHGHDH
jgi:mono/diheme cytochrome c family protein